MLWVIEGQSHQKVGSEEKRLGTPVLAETAPHL